MRINVTAHDLLDREFLLEAVFAAQLAMLLSDQRKERLADKSHLHRLAHCRYLTLQRVDELLANQEARSAVEARYLDGHGALFPDVATAFDKQLRVGQAIADMAVRLAELDGVAPAAPEDPQAVQLRAGQIVADLVEPAKADALEKLGEGRQALGVASDWVRMKLAPRAVKGAGPAAAQES
jgi:hypothetical protein